MDSRMEKTIGIIGAMDSEIALLTKKMEDKREIHGEGLIFYCGKLAGKQVIVAKCGIGKVYAALCAQSMILRFGATHLINTGVAGGLNTGLRIGDLVVSRDAVQHDFDISAFGHVKGYMGGGDGRQPTRFLADQALIACMGRAAERVLGRRRYLLGTIASGDQFVEDGDYKQYLVQAFGADAVEMEGAAVAQAAQANGVPFVILRAISDLADHQANVSFDQFEREAADVSAALVIAMLEEMKES